MASALGEEECQQGRGCFGTLIGDDATSAPPGELHLSLVHWPQGGSGLGGGARCLVREGFCFEEEEHGHFNNLQKGDWQS